MRRDELPRREKESQSAVNQLAVQIQELQDKVISMILKWQAALGFVPHSQTSCDCSEFSCNAYPRFLLAA